MHIEPRQKTTGTPQRTKSEGGKPIVAVVVGVQGDSRTLTLRIGDSLTEIPLQKGFQAGDRVLYMPLADGSAKLQHLEENLLSPLLEKFTTSEWGKLLEFAERKLLQGNQSEKELWKALQSLVAQVAQPQIKRTEAEAILAPLLEKASLLDTSITQTVSARIFATLNSVYPSSSSELPVSAKVQNLLGSLASNDFLAAKPLLQEFADAPLSQLREQNPLRLLQPLQELATWGAPEELPIDLIHKAKLAIEISLAIPLPKAAQTALQAFSNQTLSANVLAVNPNFLDLEFPEAEHALVRINLPEKSPWPHAIKPDTTLAIQVRSTSEGLAILPQPDSAYFPPEELPAYIQSQAPLSANLIDAREFVSQYTAGTPNPKMVVAFAQALHTLDLNIPHGQTLDSTQKELALRWLLTPTKDSPDLRSLLEYRAKGNREGELFAQLPEKQQEWIRNEVQKHGKRILQPQDFLDVLSRMPSALNHEKDSVTPQLQNQLQWTQKDQDTRHPDDRQQVFYFLHEGQLQKGSIQIRREKPSEKKKGEPDAPLRFHIETTTPKLGPVRLDLLVHQNELRMEFLDRSGKAEQAVQKERESLAKDLQSLGLSLVDLVYKIPSVQSTSPVLPSPPRLNFLDLKA